MNIPYYSFKNTSYRPYNIKCNTPFWCIHELDRAIMEPATLAVLGGHSATVRCLPPPPVLTLLCALCRAR